MSDSPIGLIGVGLLGSALAERMIAGGLRVVGYDLDPAAGQRLRALGGEVAAAAAELVRKCDRIVLCLPDSQVVAGVIEEIGEALGHGSLIVDATTGDPEHT